jgi:hypothetical protein
VRIKGNNKGKGTSINQKTGLLPKTLETGGAEKRHGLGDLWVERRT